MGKWWMPPSGSPALTVELPERWGSDSIEIREHLMDLVVRKVRLLIAEAEEPAETLAFMVRQLENASILGFGMTSVKKLAKGDENELWSLIHNMEMTYHLIGMAEDGTSLRWPQKVTLEKPDNGADEMTLEDWVNEVTEGMYVPSWE